MLFPSTSRALAEPNGLLAAGGDLSPATLLDAYRRGIFPWFNEGDPILWWTPDPRAVLIPEALYINRTLRKALKKSVLKLSVNRAFDEVIRACAAPRREQMGTWIHPDMISAYATLHRRGFAHSFEIWSDDELVGGLYGLRLGDIFFGESMFSRVPNASKIALIALVHVSTLTDIALIDCQMPSEHLTSMGACLLPRTEFENILQQHIHTDSHALANQAKLDARRMEIAMPQWASQLL
jgi:leucyl/phenylalanyl-tRNA--protein transferase